MKFILCTVLRRVRFSAVHELLAVWYTSLPKTHSMHVPGIF